LITSFIGWAGLARVIRGQVLSIKELCPSGTSNGRQAVLHPLRHVLPQTASYVIISATLAVPGFIVAESVLSLIGLEFSPSWEICYRWQRMLRFWYCNRG